MQAPESSFQSYKSKRILSFANLIFPQFPLPKRQKTCLRFTILSYSEKLWNVFEIALEKCEVFVQKSLSWKKYFETCRHVFCCFGVNLPTVKIWGQSHKFPLNFSYLQCQCQVKKLIRENSTKYVNRTDCFYFRPQRKTAS